jgi:hypothetical protein
VEAILFCLVIALSVQVAWAAAMSEDSADPAAQTQPATRETRPAVPVTEPAASVTETTPRLPLRPSDKPAHGYQPAGHRPSPGYQPPPGGQHNPRP